MLPSRSFPALRELRPTQLNRPDAIVWLGTALIATALFLVFFVL